MSRTRRIPDQGDVPRSTVAQRMGLSLPDFEALLPVLTSRGFPPPDETTGNFCIEAVDRWRLIRYRKLFPHLTPAQTAVHSAEVFDERLRRIYG